MQILVVDDSTVARMLLNSVFSAAGHQVLQASNGYQALALLTQHTPDIVTMDLHMPGLNGYETIARILELYNLPVVILTAADAKAAGTAMQALAAGALAVLEKPVGPSVPGFDKQIGELFRTIHLMAEVRVVRRLRGPDNTPAVAGPAPAPSHVPRLVAIAASAGGPPALKALLQQLDQHFPWPLILIQHITMGFLDSFADWLAHQSALQINIARPGQALQAGHLYLPPEGCHLEVDANGHIQLVAASRTDLNIPSANRLFHTLARHMARQVIAIQLSGMGQDGAQGMQAIKTAGGLCLVQDPETALIDSMPNAALSAASPQGVLSPQHIAMYLNKLAAAARPHAAEKESP